MLPSWPFLCEDTATKQRCKDLMSYSKVIVYLLEASTLPREDVNGSTSRSCKLCRLDDLMVLGIQDVESTGTKDKVLGKHVTRFIVIGNGAQEGE